MQNKRTLERFSKIQPLGYWLDGDEKRDVRNWWALLIDCERYTDSSEETRFRRMFESRGCIFRFVRRPAKKEIRETFSDEKAFKGLFDSGEQTENPEVFFLFVIGVSRSEEYFCTSHRTGEKYRDRLDRPDKFEVFSVQQILRKLFGFKCLDKSLLVVQFTLPSTSILRDRSLFNTPVPKKDVLIIRKIKYEELKIFGGNFDELQEDCELMEHFVNDRNLWDVSFQFSTAKKLILYKNFQLENSPNKQENKLWLREEFANFRQFNRCKIFFNGCEAHLVERMRKLLQFFFSSVKIIQLTRKKQLEDFRRNIFLVIMVPLEKSNAFSPYCDIVLAASEEKIVLDWPFQTECNPLIIDTSENTKFPYQKLLFSMNLLSFNWDLKLILSGKDAVIHVLNELTHAVNSRSEPELDDCLFSLIFPIDNNDEIITSGGQIIPLLKQPTTWRKIKMFFRKR